jgi:predicted small metal-binding protein
MKKSLGCSDLGISTCSFEARSENSVEIKDALFTHA